MSEESDELGYQPGNQYWPDDLTDALAIMAPIPVRLRPVRDNEEFDRYVRVWQDGVLEILGPVLPSVAPVYNNYQVPPAANEYVEFIFMLAENINVVVQTLDGYLGAGSAFIELAKRRKTREDPDNQTSPWDRKTFFYAPPRVIESMCFYHAYVNYYDNKSRPAIDVEFSSRGVFAGSAAHPSRDVQYTVSVTIGKTYYVYIVTADARVLEHFRLNKGRMVPLTLPDWFQERDDELWLEPGVPRRLPLAELK